MQKIVLASGNKGKIKEFSEILTDYEVIGCKELGVTEEIEETGVTFYENALIKAKYVSEKLGIAALADDSGLVVDALNGEPGVYSARYAGENGNDEKNIDKLLNNLCGKENRSAKFISTLVLYYPDGGIITASGQTCGEILKERHGNCGFGYDPVFYSYDLKKSFGEATESEKNSVSHRGRAIANLMNKLK